MPVTVYVNWTTKLKAGGGIVMSASNAKNCPDAPRSAVRKETVTTDGSTGTPSNVPRKLILLQFTALEDAPEKVQPLSPSAMKFATVSVAHGPPAIKPAQHKPELSNKIATRRKRFRFDNSSMDNRKSIPAQ